MITIKGSLGSESRKIEKNWKINLLLFLFLQINVPLLCFYVVLIVAAAS